MNLARQIPGKEEFHGLVDWFETMIALRKVDLNLNTHVAAADLQRFDEVIVATGVSPRPLDLPGADMPHVVSYIDILTGQVTAGERVAIIGAGGIGFDVAEYLMHAPRAAAQDLEDWREEWGVVPPDEARGGLASVGPLPKPSVRQITLLQRKTTRLGKGLGKTTGWIHRSHLQAKGVTMVAGAQYDKIDAQGLHTIVGGAPRLVAADTIVVCAGQDPARDLATALKTLGVTPHVIGGADVAAELDAKRAIDQGTRLAAAL